MPNKKKPFLHVEMSDQLKKKVVRRAHQERRTISEVARIALEQYLERSQLGKGEITKEQFEAAAGGLEP